MGNTGQLNQLLKGIDARMSFWNSTISHFVGQCAEHPHTSYVNNVKDVFSPTTVTVFSNHLIPMNNHTIHTSPQAICKENIYMIEHKVFH